MRTPTKSESMRRSHDRTPPELARADEKRVMMDLMPNMDRLSWGGGIEEIEELTVLFQQGSVFGNELPSMTIGWVLSGLQDYLDAGDRGTIDVPKFYSSFDDEFGDDGVYVGGIAEDGTGRKLRCIWKADRIRVGMRVCTGGGHYDPDRYTIHDAVPTMVIEGPTGVVAIMPTFKVID